MTIEEKIARLSQLFTQRADIDREIETLLGNAPEVKSKKLIAKSPLKPKTVKQPANQSLVKKPRPKPGDPKRYYCRDCKKVFESTDRLIDVVCPACDSARIDYAVRYNK
jgi:DNA-directed RNA polymerase subunit RPC12/RpoP